MKNHNMLLKLSRLFPSSFTSCQARTRTDIVDTSLSIPKSMKNISHIANSPSNSSISHKQPKSENNRSSALNTKGPKFPLVRNQSSSSQSDWWFTSNDKQTRRPADGFDTNTFYILSSNSDDSFRAKATTRRQLKGTEKSSRAKCDLGSDHALTRSYYDDVGCRRRMRRRRKNRGGIEEGVAVEKRSVDPYRDFMRSMVEMIIEKQMFGKEDLDRLLGCYLSLNKAEYHGIIFCVFYEICRTLLCN